MDELRDYHIKWSKSKTNIIWYPLYAESLKKKKKNTNELIYKTETDSQTYQNLWLSKGRGEKDKLKSLGLKYTYHYI